MKIPPLFYKGKEVNRRDSAFDFYDLFENPWGTPEKVRTELKHLLEREDLSLYPQTDYGELRKALAQHLNLSAGSFTFANGSGELLERVLRFYTKQGDEVLSTLPTWSGFNYFCQLSGVKQKHLPFFKAGTEISIDLSALEASISPQAKLIYFVSPSMPGGIGIGKKEFLDFLRKIPPSIVVIVDEAYTGFHTREDLLRTHEIVNEVPNVLIGIRTFSKVFGLAGMRCGFALSREEVMKELLSTEPPFALNSLSATAAKAAISDSDYLRKMQKSLEEEKIWLKEEITRMGLIVHDTDFHFLLVDIAGLKNNPLALFDDEGVFLPRDIFLDKFLQFPVSKRDKNEKNIRILNSIALKD